MPRHEGPPSVERKDQPPISVDAFRGMTAPREISGINYMPPAEYIARHQSSFAGIYEHDDRVFLPPIRYAGINSYFVDFEKNKILGQVHDTFKLGRLRDIRQLSFLHGVSYFDGYHEFLEGFTHTRYAHSYDVVSVATLIGSKLGLSQEEMQILQIAAFTHDYRTPAGGDSTKQVDLETFDEDKNYDEIFKTDEWKKLKEKYKITEEQEQKLYQTILGQGVLGQALDMADKIAYVSTDIENYLFLAVKAADMDGSGSHGFEEIKREFEDNKQAASFWESLELVDGKIVVGDTAQLSAFLKTRAKLWRYLYENIEGNFSIQIFIKILVKHLYQQGQITEEQLLRSGDSYLEGIVSEFLESPLFFTRHNTTFSRERFSNINDAREYAQRQAQTNNLIVIIDTPRISSIGSTKKFFVKQNEGAVNFNDAMPEEAKHIENLMQVPEIYNVYTIPLDKLEIPETERSKIKKIFDSELLSAQDL